MRNRRLGYSSVVNNNAMYGVEKMEVRQPSLVDEYYHQESVCPETGEKVIGYHHPLYMIFNQERLDRLGDGAVQMWLKSLENAGNSAYNKVKDKLSDDDMLKLVKSRHIQSPSELETWLSYLNERADVFNKEVARIVAEEKQAQEQQQQQQQVVEPSKTE